MSTTADVGQEYVRAVQPRPHQVAALADLTRALAVHDRTQLVMACGTRQDPRRPA